MTPDFQLDLSEKVNTLPLSDADKKRVVDIVFWAMEQVAPPKVTPAAGVDVPRGPAVLNALQVLERMDYKPGDRVLVENFLRIMGERGMWVIENPLTSGVQEGGDAAR